MEMPGFSSSTWTPFSDYSEIICQLHDLSPKLSIVNLLKDDFQKTSTDASFRASELGNLEDQRRHKLRIHISMQILALTVELADDLAAFCSAYFKAIRGKDKRVPQYLRDFKGADQFYKKASENIIFAAEVCGYDPIKDINQAIGIQSIFKQIHEFREKYKFWYNGYKHGQRTIPIAISFAPGSEVKWGLYMIPREFLEKNDQIFLQESFLISTEEVERYVGIAQGIVRLWFDIRNIQFPKVSDKPPA